MAKTTLQHDSQQVMPRERSKEREKERESAQIFTKANREKVSACDDVAQI